MLFWHLNPIHTQIPNSPTSITWGQANFPSSLTTISDFLNLCFFTFEPNLYSNSDSLTPITQGPTKFQLSLVTITSFWNRCFFDLWPHGWLIFGLPDLENPRSDQVSITIGHYKRLLKPMFFLPLTPWMTHIRTPWPRLSRVRPSFNHRWSSLRVSKIDVLSTPNANKHTHTQPIFFHMTLLTVEGIRYETNLCRLLEYRNAISKGLGF